MWFSIFLFDQMGKFNPLAEILKDGKLGSPNYVKWKRKMMLVSNIEGVIWVMEAQEPPLLAECQPTDAQKEAVLKWGKTNQKARVYILAPILDISMFQHYHHV